MLKDLNNMPRKENETPVAEGPNTRPNEPPADNPGPKVPTKKPGCPSGGGGRRR
jgi:hypothetical protein